MTENNWILKKLMSDNTNQFDWLEGVWEADTDKFTTASRIVQVRYRFYAVWVALLVLLLVFWFVLPGWDTYNAKQSQIQSARRTLDSLEARENQY